MCIIVRKYNFTIYCIYVEVTGISAIIADFVHATPL